MSLPNTPDPTTPAGVPAELILGTSEFMMIRPGLVRELGAVGALVWTRIHWRCSAHGQHVTVDEHGQVWWPAPRDVIAEETGLSPEQVRRAIDRLVTDGYLEKTEHRHSGNYDRTKSYRPLIRQPDRASAPNESGRTRPQDRVDSANVPPIETYPEEIVNAGAELVAVEPPVDWFAIVWAAWPKSDNKQESLKLWPRAVKSSKMTEAAFSSLLIDHANAYATHRSKSFTPALSVFLRNERWSNDLVESNGTVSQPGPARSVTSDRVQSAVDIGRAMQAAADGQLQFGIES
jgi:hypothetical protein